MYGCDSTDNNFVKNYLSSKVDFHKIYSNVLIIILRVILI